MSIKNSKARERKIPLCLYQNLRKIYISAIKTELKFQIINFKIIRNSKKQNKQRAAIYTDNNGDYK